MERRGRGRLPGRPAATDHHGQPSGPDGYRARAWKTEIAALALEAGLQITACHFPPGTSKWNKIEHRLFSHITMNWRGRHLTSYEVIIASIGATTTRTGLSVHAELDTATYPTGTQVEATPSSAPYPWTATTGTARGTTPCAPNHQPCHHPSHPQAPATPPGHTPALTGLTPGGWDQLITTLHARLGEAHQPGTPTRSTSPSRP